MPKVSAGLLLYRNRDQQLEVLLVHPGGPFWAMKDLGSWTIPKGEIAPGEDPFAAACREFEEELGFAPQGKLLPLGMVTKRAVSMFMRGPSKATAAPRHSKVIPSPSNGRRIQDECKSFPKWIGRSSLG